MRNEAPRKLSKNTCVLVKLDAFLWKTISAYQIFELKNITQVKR